MNVTGGASVAGPCLGHCKAIPVCQWGIQFDGQARGMSLVSFLERIDELRVARRVERDELFRSAVDLFSGPALIRFRSIRSSVTTWEQLESALRRDFLPSDYDDILWDEIRNRLQGSQEGVNLYNATMANLFRRLVAPPPEEEQVRLMRRNLLAYYQAPPALQKTPTIEALADVCRTLENTYRAEKRLSGGSRAPVASIESDLIGQWSESGVPRPNFSPRPGSSSAQGFSSSTDKKCFNCGSSDHFRRDRPKPIKNVFAASDAENLTSRVRIVLEV